MSAASGETLAERIVSAIESLNSLDDRRGRQIAQLHAELAELRDAMVALSNRLEAVTRATMSTDFPGKPRGRGDTITVVPEPLGDGTPCPRCGIYVHRPAHSCLVSRSNYVVA